MKASISSVFLYNIIILFIIIVFGFISATISYYKAFKVNERILGSIEKFEGYNTLSKKEITSYLSSIGYTTDPDGQAKCPNEKNSRDKGILVTDKNASHLYCVYYHSDDRGEKESRKYNDDDEPIYYNYSVTSYIYIDLPIAGSFKVPVYTKGERTYNFSDNQKQEGVR